MPQVSQHKNRIENIFDHLLCKSDSLSGIGLYSGAFGRLLFLAHLPVMIAEGLITMITVGFIARVRPEMLRLTAA